MKTIITSLAIILCLHSSIAQTDSAQNNNSLTEISQVQRTALLDQLYEEGRALENYGTPLQIEANRMAIKAAWQEINPRFADLYKPVSTEGLLPETMENLSVNGIHNPEIIQEPRTFEATRDWDTDRLLLDEFIDGGVDIDVTQSGDIYISAYQNNIDFGGAFDIIYIYRSLDGGQTFEQWQAANVTAPMRKMEMVTISGTGDEYVLMYLTTDSENFQAWRWNTTTGDFVAQVISSDVTDFSVDRNFPTNTNAQRVFATYLKDDGGCATEVFSARSTAGSYGLDWTDEVSIDSVCGEQVSFGYGFNGSIYTTYTGATSGNLYVNVNSDYNDPLSWTSRETITTGATEESVNPVIKAARTELATDNVLLVTSQRDAGTTDGYRFRLYTRENGAAFTSLFNGVPLPNQSSVQPDLWIRKAAAATDIQLSHTFQIVDASSSNFISSRTYDGAGFPSGETVSDTDVDVWEGFPAAVAETSDDLPCMAFAGTSGGGGFGQGLYFDAKTEIIILNTAENALEGLAYFPNPMRETLHVQTKNTISSVALYTITGAKILEQVEGASNKTSINTASLAAGVYLLEVRSDNQSGTYKVIKQ
ncbi:T9SS type A sorting domain-containing protein [Rasiella rasia]|uniref:T9SS type A sorting domain-containing protein n=1 Tax=Rasiella rasia TaxID=2744027 RepID=A0A6G6GMR5_9FLAO|nr:T9SS type A sorting domain-containing protein [Rasiella rasia]QIE59703.1 T9SS type A sorting domain-containing protein [Rasiella rasia]